MLDAVEIVGDRGQRGDYDGLIERGQEQPDERAGQDFENLVMADLRRRTCRARGRHRHGLPSLRPEGLSRPWPRVTIHSAMADLRGRHQWLPATPLSFS